MKRQSKFFEELWWSLPFQNQVSMKLEIKKRKTIWTKTQKSAETSSLLLSGKLTGKNLLGDKLIYRMAGGRKMMRSMPGIWRS